MSSADELPMDPEDLSAEEMALRQKIQELKEFHARLEAVSSASSASTDGASAPLTLGILVNEIALEVVDELTMEVIFEFHRQCKLGLLCSCSAGAPIEPGHQHHGIVDRPGLDIFGCAPKKAQPPIFMCPNCNVMRQAPRFTSHLEKCMGMGGRESKRVARNKMMGGGAGAGGGQDSAGAMSQGQHLKRKQPKDDDSLASKKGKKKADPDYK